jgi:hypothetical protein
MLLRVPIFTSSAGVAGHGDASRLDRVFVLPMAAALTHQMPAIRLDDPQHLSNLHDRHDSLFEGPDQTEAGVVIVATKQGATLG